MPRSAAAAGCSSTSGSRARRRRLGSARCWLSQNCVCLAQVRISGKRSARSGRETRTDQRLLEVGQRRVAVLEQASRSRARSCASAWRSPSGRRPAPRRTCGSASGAARARRPGSARSASSDDAGRAELVAVGRLDVAVPEVVAETEAARPGRRRSRCPSAPRRAARPPRRRSCTSDCASALTSKPILSASLSKGAGDRQHDVGQLGGRVHEQVGVDIEVERRQRLAPAPAVGVGEEQIGAEADQAAHRVGLLLQNGAVELVRGDELPAGRAERPLAQAERSGALLRRQQLLAGDVRRPARPGRARCRPARRSCRSGRRAGAMARAIWVALLCCSTPLQA